MDIWEKVVEASRKKEAETILDEDSTLLVVGSKKTGKTTAIYRFLNREEPPKPTLALEYTFGRQSRSNALSKDVCHIWELGGGTLFPTLLQVPISEKTLMNLTVAIMVDLSLPNELLITLSTLLDALHQAISHILESKDLKKPNLKEILTASAWKRIGENHSDRSNIRPFLVPLVIIGGKYDIFQNFEPEQRKVVCRTLRYFAHVHGATIQFFSLKMENLVTRCRVLLSHLVFGTTLSNYISQDYNKPLMVPVGTDSFQQIGVLPGMETTIPSPAAWMNAYKAVFPQTSRRSELPVDPGRDPNFKEPLIDNLRAQKDEELERYKREVSLRKNDLNVDI